MKNKTKNNLLLHITNPTCTLLAKGCVFWLIIIALTACDKNRIYDKFTEIPQAQWEYSQKMPFEVEIADTLARYNVYVNVRHNDDYPYSNLWVMLYTYLPSGKKWKAE